MRRPSLAVALCAMLAAGCGGDDEESGGRTVTVPAREAVVIAADEYSFDPSGVVVRGGGGGATPVEIELDNQGSLAHNARVFSGDEELGGTPTFQGGEARSGTVRLEPGSYELICTVGNHEELGMVGELEVRR